jgi:hypothetical protein
MLQAGSCEPRTAIVGSRFVLQGHRILDSRDEARVVEQLRHICHQSKYNVTVFHPYFIYFDQVSSCRVGHFINWWNFSAVMCGSDRPCRGLSVLENI